MGKNFGKSKTFKESIIKEKEVINMKEKVGAYRIDEHGNIVPDENDEAMAIRYKLKKLVAKVSVDADTETIKREEVNEDAIGE